MTTTERTLWRSAHKDQFPMGLLIDGEPAPGVLFPDFEERPLPSGLMRAADVQIELDKKTGARWVLAGGGTSLFDKANVFPPKKWHSFKLPEGTVIPDSLTIPFTHHSTRFQANHYQIESRAGRMPIEAYKGALENLARNAVVRAVQLGTSVIE